MKIFEDKTFEELTTFHIGGKIRYYVEPKSKEELKEAICFAKSNSLPIFVIGGGSDFLANNKNFEGVVIKYVGNGISSAGNVVTAGAGTKWDNLVRYCVDKNLQGVECLSGIPGTVGASPIQNIGAYGQELKDTFESLEAYSVERGKFVTFNKEDCKFSYRCSIFKTPKYWQKYIVTSITFKLSKVGKPAVKYDSLIKFLEKKGIKDPSLKEVRDAILEIRKERFEDPEAVGNAGSFFQNPIVGKEKFDELRKQYPDLKYFDEDGRYKIFAGWLIEKAGWKGKTYKGAGVSPKHALILINKSGKATAREIYDLSEKIIADVYKKFGVKLEREVQLVNF